jgi:hypothetical protein
MCTNTVNPARGPTALKAGFTTHVTGLTRREGRECVPTHSTKCRHQPFLGELPAQLEEQVHVLQGPCVPTHLPCMRLPFLVILEPGEQDSRHGGVRAPRGTKCHHTSLNIGSTYSPRGRTHRKACRQCFTLYSPSPLQAHAQGLTVEIVSNPPRLTDNRSDGSSRTINGQVQSSQANISIGNFEVNFLYAVLAPRPDWAQIR